MAKAVVFQIVLMPMAWVAMLYFQQDSLIYHPRRYSTELDVEAFKPDLELSELSFRTDDGRQHAIMLKHPDSKIKRAFLVFGGNAMLARDWLSVFYGHSILVRSDTALIFVDYPGFGKSEGSASRASVLRVGQQALVEADVALNEGADDRDREITYGAIGHSIGCAASMALAAEQHEQGSSMSHLLLSAPFTTLPEMAKVMMSLLGWVPAPVIGLLTSRHAWDNLLDADRMAGESSPRVDVIHGDHDAIVPFTMGEELWQRLKALDFKVSFQKADADHNDLLSMKEYVAWLDAALNN